MFPFALTDVDCLLEQMSMQIVLLGNKYNILMKKKNLERFISYKNTEV